MMCCAAFHLFCHLSNVVRTSTRLVLARYCRIGKPHQILESLLSDVLTVGVKQAKTHGHVTKWHQIR